MGTGGETRPYKHLSFVVADGLEIDIKNEPNTVNIFRPAFDDRVSGFCSGR